MARRKQLINRNDNVVEAKVKAGAIAAALSGYVVTSLDQWVTLPDAVNGQLGSLLSTAVVALITAGASFATKHTPVDITTMNDAE